ncbi:putative nicotinamide riboside kinase 1 [Podospora australis]|uniref:Nicotinamide riboside kinase 1 n=1 Tax=Podospora australis TaxID=1536484 RepID=A0AAN6WMM5_9PEZI|nr:putative nicotinamide riboside kinase 1 [Podospora australis]
MSGSKNKMSDPKAIIIGISGCSSSGKTTLARLLRDIFPSTFVLHEDDFYKSDAEIPEKDGLADWDCPEAINIPDLERALEHIRAEGTFPPFVQSKEDQNSIGPSPITPVEIDSAKSLVSSASLPSSLRICILDGFLLYSPPSFSRVMSLLDIKLFLLADKTKATQRREARDGYVTLEGFWKDPPGYVEKIVWPNYVESHKWLFTDGDVERGVLDQEVLKREGIEAPVAKAYEEVKFGEVLKWAVEVVLKKLEEVNKGGN